MAIKITYTDVGTGKILNEYTLPDEMIKVLSTDMVPTNPDGAVFADFHMNSINQKFQRERDELCEKALGAGSKKIDPLSDSAKQVISNEMAAKGYILLPPIDQMPVSIKSKIIELTTIHTAAERKAEEEAEMFKES